jgi:hypothetical protein
MKIAGKKERKQRERGGFMQPQTTDKRAPANNRTLSTKPFP